MNTDSKNKNKAVIVAGLPFTAQGACPIGTGVMGLWFDGTNLMRRNTGGTDDILATLTDATADVVKKATVTLTAAAIVALGAATSGNINIGAALPAGARIVGFDLGEGTFTGIDDATHATWNVSLGGAGAADIAANVNCSAGQSGFPKAGTAGALGFQMAPQGSQQLHAHVSSTVNMSTCTAGNVVVNVFYIILP